MKTATENFVEIEKRLGKKMFRDLYENEQPKTFEIVEEKGDEICMLQEFEFHNGEMKMLKVWGKKEGFIINE